VLELKVPGEPTLHALWEDTGTGLLTYLLSFVYIGIYWNNHHHMFQLVDRVNGAVLWANLTLLLALSLYPFTTAWMDEQIGEVGIVDAHATVVVYGVNLLFAAVAYYVLQLAIFRAEGDGSQLREAVGGDWKGKLSPLLYVAGILTAAWLHPAVGIAFFVLVAIIWLVPDRRLERYVVEKHAA
jgi:uncharacterized membrane protein